MSGRQSAFVHHFIGESLAVPVTIDGGGVHFAGRRLDLDSHGLSDGEASLFVRPYEVAIVPDAGAAALNGVVKRVHGFGPARRLEIALREGDREHFIELNAPRHDTIGDRTAGRPAAAGLSSVRIGRGSTAGRVSLAAPPRNVSRGRAPAVQHVQAAFRNRAAVKN